MGDVQFSAPYRKVREAKDRAPTLARLTDEEVVEALAAASRDNEPLLANVLATEATNRMRRLRATLAHLAEGVLTIDASAIIRWANPAAERLLALPRASIVGERFDEIVRCAEGSRVLEAALRLEPLPEQDETLARRDGSSLLARCTVSPILSEHGEVVGAVVTLQDASAQKQREQQLQRKEQRYRALFDLNLDPVVTIEPDGRIVDVNRAAAELTGFDAPEILGRSFHAFVDPEDVDRVAALFVEATNGAVARRRFVLRGAGGAAIPVEAAGIPVVVDGEVLDVHCVARRLG